MTSLFLDLSGGCLRYLAAGHGRLTAAHTLDGPPVGPEELPQLIARISTATGQHFDQAHLIMAHRDITAASYRLQDMSLADARQVVQRRIAVAGEESSAPQLHLLAMKTDHHTRTYLAEQVASQTVARYFDACSTGGLRLKTVMTPLQALLAAMTPLREQMLQPHAIFGIERDAVIALFLSATEVLHYARVELPAGDDETETGDAERALKRKLFAILNVVHGVYSQYMLDNPQGYLGKVWLFGADAAMAGLSRSLAEAMDVEVAVVDLLAGESGDQRPGFAALAGLLRVHDDPQRGNFLTEQLARPGRLRPRLAGVALAASAVTLVLLVVAAMETRAARRNQELLLARQELAVLESAARGTETLARNLDHLGKLATEQPQLHEILRDLAATLPDRVFLDAVRFTRLADRGLLELVTVTDSALAAHREPLFSAIVAAVKSSPRLALQGDPAIALIKEGDQRLVEVTLICTIVPPGGTGR